MKSDFTLTALIPAKAAVIYTAWVTTKGHTAMTGSPAKVKGRAGGDFTAWDGYIWGTFLELDENHRIVQTWRTSEFPEDAQDSHVEVLLEEDGGNTRLTLIHTKVPDGQDSYKQGWEDFYFKPMKEYFSK